MMVIISMQNILVVDDFPANIVALETILTGLDLNICKALSGEEALGILIEHDIALAIVDVMMPQMDGYELATMMKDNKRTRHIPIIFITAMDTSIGNTFKGYESGAVDYLYKPIEPVVLISKVKVFTQMHQHKKELQHMTTMLTHSQEKYRKLIETTDDAIFIVDAETGIITDINEAAENLLGQTREEIVGMHQSKLHPPQEAQRYGDLFKKSIAKDKSFNESLEVITKSGQVIPVDIRAGIIELDGRKAIAGFFRDITKYKYAQKAIMEKTVYLDNILCSSFDMAIVATDIGLTIKYFNPMAEVLLDVKANDVIGKTLTEIHSQQRVNALRVETALQQVNRGQEYTFSFDRQSHGSVKSIEGRVFGIRDKDKALTGYIWMLHDITERQHTRSELNRYCNHLEEMVQLRTAELQSVNKQLEEEVASRKKAEDMLKIQAEELSRSNNELEHFAYMASHDLQEPLRKIAGFTELLKQRYKGRLDPKADKFIDYIVDGTNRMKKLINDMLEFSRVGTQGKSFKPVDFSQALQSALSNLQRSVDESNATVTNDPLPVIMTDETQIVQLFQNLIANAIRFRTDSPPKIHVSAKLVHEGQTVETIDGFVRPAEPQWLLSISDNGIGIDAEDYDRIFMMFHRLHGRGEYEGTGIGLAICKKIVERHGGHIWVESRMGVGSTFYFTLCPSFSH